MPHQHKRAAARGLRTTALPAARTNRTGNSTLPTVGVVATNVRLWARLNADSDLSPREFLAGLQRVAALSAGLAGIADHE